MAVRNHSVSFKNAEINLEEGTIIEFAKEDIKVYRLLDELRKFEGEGRRINLTIKEVFDLEPAEVDGE
jgi:predicted RNA-binding protein